jgi:type III pantothenate kinase
MQYMNLVVDYGNTAAKVGIFDQRELKEEHAFFNPEELLLFIKSVPADGVIFSSVSRELESLQQSASHISMQFVLNYRLPLPITNNYATPETLGVDRLAGVCGAKSLFPESPCLVIDSGTCVTYDLITADAVFLGGLIAPGLYMRLRAMHKFTARLPQVEINPAIDLTGYSTETCLQSGAFNGMLAEIEGIISRYLSQYPQLRVILCGGDTHFFENKLKGPIFAVQNLVLRGLNSILLHNVGH